jgi:crotonobetaine/carnitine-CoA ligase
MAAEVVAPAYRSLPALLERRARERPGAPLLRIDGVERSFEQMRAAVARRAGSLRAHGVEPGDHVAIMSDQRLPVLDLCVGAIWAGAVAVPVNTALRGAQLAHVLADSGAKALVIDAELLPALSFLDVELPALERIWVLGESAADGGARETAPLPPPGAEQPRQPTRPGGVAMILYTSGTTGPSKGVLRPHGQMYWWARQTARMLEIGPADVLYTCLPLFHTNALNAFAQAVVAGAVFHPGRRFSASVFWQRLVDSGATVTYLLGPMAQILAQRPPGEWDRAHGVRVALAPGTAAELYPVLRERFGIDVVDAWGATEANLVLSTAGTGAPPGSMGTVVDGFEAKVVDAEDDEVPAGEPGELVVRARDPFAFARGYQNLPEKTVEAWRNLWLHTGDRVVRDADGWFWFLDRVNDSIRRRGENISSYEVEQAIVSHPDVELVAAVPVPADIGEDEVMAFVVPRAGAEVDPVSLIRHCEPRLAYFAIPRYLEVVESLPMTANGRIEKYRLRARGISEASWDRDAAGVKVSRQPVQR